MVGSPWIWPSIKNLHIALSAIGYQFIAVLPSCRLAVLPSCRLLDLSVRVMKSPSPGEPGEGLG
jgi:hypothetical protein